MNQIARFAIGTYLIPPFSKGVASLVRDGVAEALSSHFLYARIASVTLILLAVVGSCFNTLSYILQIPLKIPLNIVQFNVRSLVTDPFQDLLNAIRSVAFIPLAICFAVTGLFFPSVFIYLKPELAAEETLLQKTQALCELNKAENKELEMALIEAKETIVKLSLQLNAPSLFDRGVKKAKVLFAKITRPFRT